MKLNHVLGNTWVIEGNGLMGLYRLDDSRCILLDSGEITERDDLARLLDDHGLTPVGTICSHIHPDHTINNVWLKERYGTRVAIPCGEANIARAPKGMKAFFFSASPGALAQDFRDIESPMDDLIPWEDGDFSFCGVTFRILHTPGHSIDHISIVTPDRVCYAGDAVICGDFMLKSKLPYHIYLETSLHSGEKLKGTDCDFYIIPHRGVRTDIDMVVDEAAAHLLQKAEEILSLITRPMTFSEIWFAVNEQFSLLSSRPVRAALMERNLRSFVDFLVDKGRLKWYAERGMLYYAPVEDKHET